MNRPADGEGKEPNQRGGYPGWHTYYPAESHQAHPTHPSTTDLSERKDGGKVHFLFHQMEGRML